MDEFNSPRVVPASLLRWELTRREHRRPGSRSRTERPLLESSALAGKVRQDLADDASGLYAGQLGREALEVVGEPLVVDAEQVQECGLEVSDVYPVINNVVGELVGFAIDDPALDAAARHPEAETARVMVAAVVGRVSLPWE